MTGAPGHPPARQPAAEAPVRVTSGCAGCGACLLTCPERAIRPLGGTLLVRAELCNGCGECVEVCPVDAIEETGAPGAPARPDAPGLPPPPALPLPLPRSADPPSGGSR